MLGIGSSEFLVIIVVAVLVLGPEHLPRIMRTVTKVMSDFRRISTELQRVINLESFEEEEKKGNTGKKKKSSSTSKSTTKKKTAKSSADSDTTKKEKANAEKSSPKPSDSDVPENVDTTKKKPSSDANVDTTKHKAEASASASDASAKTTEQKVMHKSSTSENTLVIDPSTKPADTPQGMPFTEVSPAEQSQPIQEETGADVQNTIASPSDKNAPFKPAASEK